MCDRSAIDPIVYAILTSSNSDEANERKEALTGHTAFQRALETYQGPHSVFILLAPVEAWLVDDGVRSLEDHEACMNVFIEVLKDLGISYHVFDLNCQFLLERVLLTMGYIGM